MSAQLEREATVLPVARDAGDHATARAAASLVRVVKAALPFVGVLFIFLILVTYFEPLSTWLPYALMGPEIVTR